MRDVLLKVQLKDLIRQLGINISVEEVMSMSNQLSNMQPRGAIPPSQSFTQNNCYLFIYLFIWREKGRLIYRCCERMQVI